MADDVQTPRSRGSLCGLALILLGAWAGLAPFAGPSLRFGFTPDRAWAYTSGRLYLSALPGAVVLLAGLIVAMTRNRSFGGICAFVAGPGGGWPVRGDGAVPGRWSVPAARPLRADQRRDGARPVPAVAEPVPARAVPGIPRSDGARIHDGHRAAFRARSCRAGAVAGVLGRLNGWRRRTGIEPAGDAERRPPVLKTGEPTRCPDASAGDTTRSGHGPVHQSAPA